MEVKDSILSSRRMSSSIVSQYISDLNDADLMLRPSPGCNHLAWQLGHLIAADKQLLEEAGAAGFALPEGFADAHAKTVCSCDDPTKFYTKEQYLELLAQADVAVAGALAAMSNEKFDEPSPEWIRSFCPTLGQYFGMIATHSLMHAGQFAVVRRQLGKPILI